MPLHPLLLKVPVEKGAKDTRENGALRYTHHLLVVRPSDLTEPSQMLRKAILYLPHLDDVFCDVFFQQFKYFSSGLFVINDLQATPDKHCCRS